MPPFKYPFLPHFDRKNCEFGFDLNDWQLELKLYTYNYNHMVLSTYFLWYCLKRRQPPPIDLQDKAVAKKFYNNIIAIFQISLFSRLWPKWQDSTFLLNIDALAVAKGMSYFYPKWAYGVYTVCWVGRSSGGRWARWLYVKGLLCKGLIYSLATADPPAALTPPRAERAGHWADDVRQLMHARAHDSRPAPMCSHSGGKLQDR